MGLMGFNVLCECLKQAGIVVGSDSLEFYLNYLRIELSKDLMVNIYDMRSEFYKQAKRLGIKNLVVFQEADDDIVKQGEK